MTFDTTGSKYTPINPAAAVCLVADRTMTAVRAILTTSQKIIAPISKVTVAVPYAWPYPAKQDDTLVDLAGILGGISDFDTNKACSLASPSVTASKDNCQRWNLH